MVIFFTLTLASEVLTEMGCFSLFPRMSYIKMGQNFARNSMVVFFFTSDLWFSLSGRFCCQILTLSDLMGPNRPEGSGCFLSEHGTAICGKVCIQLSSLQHACNMKTQSNTQIQVKSGIENGMTYMIENHSKIKRKSMKLTNTNISRNHSLNFIN